MPRLSTKPGEVRSNSNLTGIPQDIADGLKQGSQGKRRASGYSFRSDPTEGLVDAAREIAQEAEFDAAETAAGRGKTSVGYLEPEQAKETMRALCVAPVESTRTL